MKKKIVTCHKCDKMAPDSSIIKYIRDSNGREGVGCHLSNSCFTCFVAPENQPRGAVNMAYSDRSQRSPLSTASRSSPQNGLEYTIPRIIFPCGCSICLGDCWSNYCINQWHNGGFSCGESREPFGIKCLSMYFFFFFIIDY